MINLNEMSSLPAYTTKDIVSFGKIYKKHSLYNCRFIRQDNLFLHTGDIKLLPLELSNFYVNHSVILNGKSYKENEEVNPNEFEFHVLKTLIKTKVLKCELKEPIKKDIIKEIIEKEESHIPKQENIEDILGKTFKEISEIFNIPFEVLKEKFELKQGGHRKKVTEKEIKKIQELIGE